MFANKRSITPSSVKYSKVPNWKECFKNTTIAKAKKVTVFAEIFEREKRSRSPAPNSYTTVIKSCKDQYKLGKQRKVMMLDEV